MPRVDIACWLAAVLIVMLAIVVVSLWLELQGERERAADLERVLKANREALKRYGSPGY